MVKSITDNAAAPVSRGSLNCDRAQDSSASMRSEHHDNSSDGDSYINSSTPLIDPSEFSSSQLENMLLEAFREISPPPSASPCVGVVSSSPDFEADFCTDSLANGGTGAKAVTEYTSSTEESPLYSAALAVTAMFGCDGAGNGAVMEPSRQSDGSADDDDDDDDDGGEEVVRLKTGESIDYDNDPGIDRDNYRCNEHYPDRLKALAASSSSRSQSF